MVDTATTIDKYAALVNPERAAFQHPDKGIGSRTDSNVIQRDDTIAILKDAANDPARPVLAKPSVDPRDETTFFGQYDTVISDLDKLAEGATIDPAVFERIKNHLKQIQDMLYSSDGSMNLEAMLIAVLSVMNEMRSGLKQISIADLNHQNLQIQEKNDEKLQEILSALEASAKAKDASKFSKAFGWLATAAAAVFMGASILASGGMSTPAAIAGFAFCVTLFMQVDAEFFQGKAMEKMFSWMGDKGPEIMGYILMAATMAASLYGIVHAAGGFAKVASNIKQLGPNLMQLFGRNADDAAVAARNTARAAGGAVDDAAGAGGSTLDVTTENVQKMEQRLHQLSAELIKYSTYIGLGSEIAKSGTEMKVAYHDKEAELARADMKEIQATLRMLEEMIAIVSDMLKTVNNTEVSSAQFVSEVVKMMKDAKVHTSKAFM